MAVRDGLTLQIVQRFPLDLSLKKIKVLSTFSRSGQVTFKQAKRLVSRGLARWEGDRAIRMVEYIATAIDQHVMRRREAEMGYDRIDRILDRRDFRHLPIVRGDLALQGKPRPKAA